MKGFFNHVLFIDLSNKKFRVEKMPDAVYENYLGGKGLATYLLLRHNEPGIDPFSSKNNFIIAVGPATDTKVWGSSRYGVFTKSPLTGIYSESYSGGRVAESISRTGFDAIVLQGSSSDPMWLEITDSGVVFHDAGDLWGLHTYEAEDAVKKKLAHREAGVLVIGPAGENLVRFSIIANNYWRCAGRTGVGAVLGAKKVKALAFHGEKKREVAYPELMSSFWDEWLEKSKDHPVVKVFKDYGTPALVAIVNKFEAFPSRYWSQGTVDGWEKIGAESLHEICNVKPHACNKCFMACGRLTEVVQGRHKGLKIEGPEYETIYSFGGLCMVLDINEIAYLNDICDRLGMDTITAGNLIAFAIEASKRGKISEKLDYGDVEAIVSLLHRIAKKEGIGAVLAEGIRHAAKEWDLEDLAIHVKGMEPAAYDPRILKGMGLAYATSDRGACHLRATIFKAELSGMIAPDQIEGKAEVFVDYEDRLTLLDSLIICRFYRDLYLWDELNKIIYGTTGMNLDKQGLQKLASRIRNATRTFNLREGITASDDTLPRRFFTEAIGSKHSVITEEELETMKKDYYRLRGWDEKGIPPPLPLI
ncbi:MAG: aldehyde:ferredoxin oxidoreductase [Deltaproteobacteria bacterium]|nr:MAG: aldehyde:ferredoxin oxidoreductase [Deltaproteobacteria bacterium]